MRDARRRRHKASRPSPEDVIPDLKLGLAGEHVERVDVVVVGMRINSLEVGSEAQLDDLELWKLPENPVMSLAARELFPAFWAECDDAVQGHVASLSDRVRPVELGAAKGSMWNCECACISHQPLTLGGEAVDDHVQHELEALVLVR